MANTPITVAHGDGIGTEIMAARLHILNTRKMLGLYANVDNRGTKVWPNGFPDTVAKYESLYNFDGKAGFTLGQGQ